MTDHRTVISRGTVYLPGHVHGFAPRSELRLPEAIAAALDAAQHTVGADEIEAERQAAAQAEKPPAG